MLSFNKTSNHKSLHNKYPRKTKNIDQYLYNKIGMRKIHKYAKTYEGDHCGIRGYWKFLENMEGLDYDKALHIFLRKCKKANVYKYGVTPLNDFKKYFNERRWRFYIVDENNIIRSSHKKRHRIFVDKSIVTYNKRNVINLGKIRKEPIIGQDNKVYYLGELYIYRKGKIIKTKVYHKNHPDILLTRKGTPEYKVIDNYLQTFEEVCLIGINELPYYMEYERIIYLPNEEGIRTIPKKIKSIGNFGIECLNPVIYKNQNI